MEYRGDTSIAETSYPDHSIYSIEDHPNRKGFNPEAEEEIPNDLPSTKGPKVKNPVETP